MDYKNTISKIKTDDEFKENLISNLEEREAKKLNKGGFIMKLRKLVITIVAILSALVGGGAVYAALGGTINGVPVLEWMGIKFSEENYAEYVEIVENQIIEDDNFKIALESTVCDDGFTILQFRVNLSDEMVKKYFVEDGVVFCYLSFNDPVLYDNGYAYTNLSGSNYNLIIDNEEVWVRGYSAQQIEEVSTNEFIIYQMWFLDETTLDGKEDFTITLNDVSLGLGNDAIAIEGSFEVEVSKEKALENTTTYELEEGNSITYGKVTKTLEKITITPLQNIITIRTVYEDVSIDDLTYVPSEDYVGNFVYDLAFDQDDNNLLAFTADLEAKITYEDGTVEEVIPGECDWSRDDFEHATYETIEKVAIEQNSSITKIVLKLYEDVDKAYSGYYDYIKALGNFEIDLETGSVKTIVRNEYIFSNLDQDPTDELLTVLPLMWSQWNSYEEFYEYWSSVNVTYDEETGEMIIEDDYYDNLEEEDFYYVEDDWYYEEEYYEEY